MRVALPAWRMLSPRGGVGRMLCALLAEYAELAPAAEFVVFGDEPTVDLPAAGNVSYRAVPTAVPRAPWWNHVCLPAAVRGGRFDLLHNLGYVLPHGTPCPAVVTIHDVAFLRHPEWFPPRAARFLAEGARHAARRADLVVTDSAHAAGEAAELLPIRADRLRVVPLGVEARFHAGIDPTEVRRRLDLPERMVLYVGDVRPRRGVDRLIEAAARVLPDRGVTLVLAGGARDLAWDPAEAAARAGLGRWFRRLGYVAEADLPALYAAAELFCWPSVYEGFGLPPLEALACGVPTIVADASSLPEVVGEAAIRVRPNHPDDLAGALAAGLDDEAWRAQLRAAGPARAARFTWRLAAERMLRLYREVAP